MCRLIIQNLVTDHICNVYRTLLIYPFLHMFVFTIIIVVECCVQMFNTKLIFYFNTADFQSVRFVTQEHAV